MKKRLIGALGVAVIALAGWYWTQVQPSKNPVSASAAGTSSVVSAAPMVEVMVPAEFSTQAGQGETYYNAVCASCHGANAAGQDGIAPPLVHRIYEPSHHGDAAFFLAARNGVRAHHWKFGNMPAVEQPLTDSELGAIVAYVRELQRANGIN
ncbi:c-type cytochrome [Pseudorhodobacter aquimaris]|uniref:c-type cytochrome n=1 Tax=Pseudorhodobacter aquimaris TaxID=687412 RepID=UPI00067DED94|nr:c-type cytochrome [Pseudorhodobacter aquimaris]